MRPNPRMNDPAQGDINFHSLISCCSLFWEIGVEAQQDVASLAKMRCYGAGARIMHPRGPGGTLYVLFRGRVKLAILGDNGRQMTLAVLRPGEFFGETSLLVEGERMLSALACQDTTVLCLSRESLFDHFERFPATAVTFLMALSRRMRERNAIIARLGLLEANGRLASTLFALARRDGRGGGVIPSLPTHQELADMIGTRRETVSRAMSGFARQGLVQVRGRGLVLSPQLGRIAA